MFFLLQFKYCSGEPQSTLLLLFWAKEIQGNAIKRRGGVTKRAEAIVPCQHYCVCSAHENLRSTERFYSHGVCSERLSCLAEWEVSLNIVCLYRSDRDGEETGIDIVADRELMSWGL